MAFDMAKTLIETACKTILNKWMDTVAHDVPMQIFEVEYRQSEILFKLDPEAYRDALARFEEMEQEERDAEP